MTAKDRHKKLKRAVNEAEIKRNNDRSNSAWYDMKTLKKLKLIAKEKLYEIKQKLHA